jgi:hypothetical protein
MTLKDAMKRIEELERRLKELEAQPRQVFEYHYHQPAQPMPYYPWWWNQPQCGPQVWGAANVGAVAWTDGLGNTGTHQMVAS